MSPHATFDEQTVPACANKSVKSHKAAVDARLHLNDGNTIPQVALGVYKAPNGKETEDSVTAALDAGYRHIDSAARYANEEAVGRAVRSWLDRTGTDRSQVFVTSKLWDEDHGYDSAKGALQSSLDKFGLDYLDLYLIHSPAKCEKKRLESWQALSEAKDAGKIRSIGVSNFGRSHIKHMLDNSDVKPVVNQIEVHPFLPRDDLVNMCQENDILIESYSPLARGNKLEDERVQAIATKHGKTSAQILLNWNASRGNVVLPKSMNPSRIESNAQIFDFELDNSDREILEALGQEGYCTGSLHVSD
jgi:2,5-diketo-D-gluconate reductase A